MFENYQVFDPGVDRPLAEVSRQEARRHFKHHLASLSERIEELAKLVGAAGIDLDFSDRSLAELDEWFPRAVLAAGVEESWPAPEAFSVCNDIGMYLGELVTKRSPELEWRMEAGGKRGINYQRPVIMGYTGVENPRYSVDFDMALCRYAVRLAQGGSREEGSIPSMVSYSLERA